MLIAILPGDGIGPEIVTEAVAVIDALRADGLPIDTKTAPSSTASAPRAVASVASGSGWPTAS